LTPKVTSGCNLYAFLCPSHCEDESNRQLVDASAGDTSGLGPQVQGVLAIPPSGSDVYFVAHGVLAGLNEEGSEPAAGLNNLYVYHLGEHGAPGETRFIATLAGADESLWAPLGGIGVANVTPDGNVLVFPSHRALTGDVARSSGPAQIYRYDFETKQLARVSIGQTGFRDDGNSSTGDARIVNAYFGFNSGDGVASSNPTMSSDGRLVFFQSPAGLTPGALNDQLVTGDASVLAQNVYEWEAFGAKPSKEAQACAIPAGCVSLISDGRDRTEGTNAHENLSAVELLGTDAAGENAFFWTADSILPSDTDSQVDLYDARVEGGITEPQSSNSCGSLPECHPEPPTPPGFDTPGSSVFSGLGNLILPVIVAPKPSFGGKPQTRSQLLARTLRSCRAKYTRQKHRRASCEKQARHRYRAPSLGSRRTLAAKKLTQQRKRMN
jgi:hypothetical protein